jgi:hypothetical protein
MNSITKISCLLIAMSFSYTASAQDRYATTSTIDSNSNPSAFEIASLRGTVTTFNNLPAFQAAAPIATNSEDFETNVTGGNLTACVGDINSSTNNACFTPGQIVGGININAAPPGDTVLLPPGFNGLTSSVLGAITFSSTTELAFTDGTTQAFAFNLYAGLTAADVDIFIFDLSDALIDTVTVSGIAVLPGNQFIGIVAPSPVGRISIATQGGSGELIDNLLFGPLGPPPSAGAIVNPANGTNLNFGSGGTAGSSSVTIMNAVSATADLTNINCSFSGGDAANFNVDTTLPGGPLAPGQSLIVQLSATVAQGENLSTNLTCTYDGDATNTSSSWTSSISGTPRVIPSLGFYGILALIIMVLFGTVVARRKFI